MLTNELFHNWWDLEPGYPDSSGLHYARKCAKRDSF